MRRDVLVGMMVVGIGSVTSWAAVAAPAAKTPAPKSGTWKLHQTFHETSGGQFAVTHHHAKIKALQTKIGSDRTQYCGTGTVHVLGKYPVHLAHGGGTRTYIVGKGLDGSMSYGVSPVKATVRFNGTKYPGDVRMRFSGSSTAYGQIDFDPVAGVSCELPFNARHHN